MGRPKQGPQRHAAGVEANGEGPRGPGDWAGRERRAPARLPRTPGAPCPAPVGPLTLTLTQLVSSPVAATHDTASRQAWCASTRPMRPAARKARMTSSGEKTATQGTAQAGTWLVFSGKLYRQYCKWHTAWGVDVGGTHMSLGQWLRPRSQPAHSRTALNAPTSRP